MEPKDSKNLRIKKKEEENPKRKRIIIFKLREDHMSFNLVKKKKGDVFTMKQKDIAIGEYIS